MRATNRVARFFLRNMGVFGEQMRLMRQKCNAPMRAGSSNASDDDPAQWWSEAVAAAASLAAGYAERLALVIIEVSQRWRMLSGSRIKDEKPST